MRIADSPSVSHAVLEVRDLVKRFGNVTAVDGISFQIQPGECVGILGPNGAGKTTTLEIAEGLQPATSGEVRLFGTTWAQGGQALRSRIGVLLQETRFRDKLTAEEVVRLFGSFYPKSLPALEALRSVSLDDKRRERVMNLSGGQRQRLALAVSLVSDPELLFLDEPTTGLDPHARRELWDLIRALHARGRSLVLTTHYMDEAAALSDRLIIIDHGKIIAEGTPRGLVDKLSTETIVYLNVPSSEDAGLSVVEGVQAARRVDETLELSVHALHLTLPRLMAYLQARGVQASGLSTRAASLEDVFLSLTGRPYSPGESALSSSWSQSW
jgi:ABC-2 type transport system ATP-binding protein